MDEPAGDARPCTFKRGAFNTYTPLSLQWPCCRTGWGILSLWRLIYKHLPEDRRGVLSYDIISYYYSVYAMYYIFFFFFCFPITSYSLPIIDRSGLLRSISYPVAASQLDHHSHFYFCCHLDQSVARIVYPLSYTDWTPCNELFHFILFHFIGINTVDYFVSTNSSMPLIYY